MLPCENNYEITNKNMNSNGNNNQNNNNNTTFSNMSKNYRQYRRVNGGNSSRTVGGRHLHICDLQLT